jgi:hypothetical protein
MLRDIWGKSDNSGGRRRYRARRPGYVLAIVAAAVLLVLGLSQVDRQVRATARVTTADAARALSPSSRTREGRRWVRRGATTGCRISGDGLRSTRRE